MDQATQLRKLALRQGRLPGGRGLFRPQVRSVAITSGKGGVGKSNLALNLGLALRQLGQRVLLVDADLGLANLDVLLGLAPRQTLEDALNGLCSLDAVLVEVALGLLLLPARSGVAQVELLEVAQQQHLLTSLAQLDAQVDYLLIDTGAGVSPQVMGFNAAADEVIIIATPEPTSLADSYALIKLLHQRNRPQHLHVVANQAASQQEGLWVYRRLNAVSRQYLGREISFLGSIPRDAAIRAAVRARQPFLLNAPNSPAARGVRQLAAALLRRAEAPAAPTPASWPAPTAAPGGPPPPGSTPPPLAPPQSAARRPGFWERLLHSLKAERQNAGPR